MDPAVARSMAIAQAAMAESKTKAIVADASSDFGTNHSSLAVMEMSDSDTPHSMESEAEAYHDPTSAPLAVSLPSPRGKHKQGFLSGLFHSEKAAKPADCGDPHIPVSLKRRFCGIYVDGEVTATKEIKGAWDDFQFLIVNLGLRRLTQGEAARLNVLMQWTAQHPPQEQEGAVDVVAQLMRRMVKAEEMRTQREAELAAMTSGRDKLQARVYKLEGLMRGNLKDAERIVSKLQVQLTPEITE